MKKRRIIGVAFLLITVLCMVFTTACSDETDKIKQDIVGTFVADNILESEYEFKENGTMCYSTLLYSDSGTYEVKGNKVEIVFYEYPDDVSVVQCRYEDGELILIDTVADEEVVFRRK
ncbi:MAG: hypothetical protein IKU26_01950 [Clostridia bacterium]|nr:hypothetical protein [Clostridia bacterium]